jgi:Protein of unknown function (DUF3179)
VWRRESSGLVLTFHLAGINNQNFLMRDDQTGSYWQQITGAAVSGPLAGRRLTLVASDELSFGLWAAEEPNGTVLKDAAKYASHYAKKDWEAKIQKDPTVLSFANPALGLKPRSLMLGVQAFGASRAYLLDAVLQDKLVLDRVGTEPVLLVVGPDGQSVRVFHDRIPGVEGDPAFYRAFDDKQSHPTDVAWLKQAATAPLLMDEATGGNWNFQGCALSGKAQGVCLEPVTAIKDFWFDWRNYNPNTTVYTGKH